MNEHTLDVDTFDWSNWVPTDDAVLSFIRTDGHVLLIEKKRGLGGGKVNGPGGKLEDGETAYGAVLRETEEEVGLVPVNPTRVAELSFVFLNGYSLRCDVFLAEDYRGGLRETPEAKPFWTSVDRVPFDRMWQDDILWLPRVLKGDRLSGVFIFDDDEMLSYRIYEGLDENHRTGLSKS
jgi:8-oxo-dGTP diphosphatase